MSSAGLYDCPCVGVTLMLSGASPCLSCHPASSAGAIQQPMSTAGSRIYLGTGSKPLWCLLCEGSWGLGDIIPKDLELGFLGLGSLIITEWRGELTSLRKWGSRKDDQNQCQTYLGLEKLLCYTDPHSTYCLWQWSPLNNPKEHVRNPIGMGLTHSMKTQQVWDGL